MDRRAFLALLSAPALAALLQACGRQPGVRTLEATPAAEPGAATTTRRDRAPAPAQALSPDAGAAAAAYNELGGALYEMLVTAKPNANLVFSPTSIAVALAMTSAGARGGTLSEMLDTLEIADDRVAEIHRDTAALMAALASRMNADVALSIVNSLWGRSGFAFEQAFLDVLASEYRAELKTVDYAADPEAARVAINKWVSDNTAARIPELIPGGVINASTLLTLVNAIYMKAPWSVPFVEEASDDQPFHLQDGTTVMAPAMHATMYINHARGLGWTAVELPYHSGMLAMTIVVPDATLPATSFAPQPRRQASDDPSWTSLAAALPALSIQRVQLTLPKFDIESNVPLAETLAALGMPAAFVRGSADFTGITPAPPLYISAVIHQANITVDEEGTEAAAATAIVLQPSCFGECGEPEPEPIEVIIDRPFLFAVRDVGTGAILFLGRVADPTVG